MTRADELCRADPEWIAAQQRYITASEGDGTADGDLAARVLAAGELHLIELRYELAEAEA